MDTLSSSHDVQVAVDGEVADLVARTEHLDTRQNDLTPVSKLPEEILQHIFVILRNSYIGNYYDWLRVTHVCRYWRYVAIAFPSLWTRLYDPPLGICRLVLERSLGAPLDVRLGELVTPEDTSILTVILSEIQRIKSLTIYNMSPDILDVARDIFAGLNEEWEASIMESLEVDLVINWASVEYSVDMFRPSHRLRRLYLSGGFDTWGVLPLPGLTHLNLYGQCIGEVAGPELIEGLRHMHSLKSLVIGWHLHPFSLSPPARPVRLPCLQKLEIVGYQHTLESFLSFLAHPKLRQLTVRACNPTVDLVPFIKSVLPSIKKANFGPLGYLKILSCRDIVIAASPETYVWGLLNDDDAASSFIHMFTRDARAQLNTYDNGTPFDFVVDVMSCITPLVFSATIDLHHVSLDSAAVPIDEFTRLFAHLSHLESIELKFEISSVLLKVLDATSISHSGIPNESILFPNLQSIIWQGHHYHASDAAGPFFSVTMFNDLYRVLLARRVRGAPINKLSLVKCPRLEEMQANQLEEIGVEVQAR